MNLYSQKRCELYWVIILLSFGAFPAGFVFWMFSPKQPEYFLNGCVISVSGVIVANVIQMLFEIRNYLKTLCDLTSIQHQSEIKYNQKIIPENIANQDTNNLQNQEKINSLNRNKKLKRSPPLNEELSLLGMCGEFLKEQFSRTGMPEKLFFSFTIIILLYSWFSK